MKTILLQFVLSISFVFLANADPDYSCSNPDDCSQNGMTAIDQGDLTSAGFYFIKSYSLWQAICVAEEPSCDRTKMETAKQQGKYVMHMRQQIEQSPVAPKEPSQNGQFTQAKALDFTMDDVAIPASNGYLASGMEDFRAAIPEFANAISGFSRLCTNSRGQNTDACWYTVEMVRQVNKSRRSLYLQEHGGFNQLNRAYVEAREKCGTFWKRLKSFGGC